MASRKPDSISLDDLNPVDLEGTADDIALVERGLALIARKQLVWSAVLELWKKRAGIPIAPAAMQDERPAGIRDIATLVQLYRMDERSPFHKVHFRTRENYDALLRRIERELGSKVLVGVKGEDIQNIYSDWAKTGATAMAHSLITMLRGMFGFGATILGDSECERLSVIMHKMRFPMLRSRSVRMTREDATKIIKKAHEKGLHSIALGQAIQFELGLGQKSVIGEWVPLDEPGESDIKSAGMKWLRGLRWGEINPSQLVECPMTADAIEKITVAKIGPMIVYEKTRLPYLTYQWRREWRQIANEAGVPKAVYNMDSRGRRTSANPGNGQAHQAAPSDSDHDPKDTREARH